MKSLQRSGNVLFNWQSKESYPFLLFVLFTAHFPHFFSGLDFCLYFCHALFVALQNVKAICVMSHCSSPVEVQLFPVKEIRE